MDVDTGERQAAFGLDDGGDIRGGKGQSIGKGPGETGWERWTWNVLTGTRPIFPSPISDVTSPR